MKDLTVLISASGSPSIPGIIACFKNNGERKIRVVGVDMSDEPSARYMVDAFYQVPAATHPDYCNILLDICKKEHVDIYFPGVSAEVSALVKRWDDFKRIGVTLSVSNSNSVDVARHTKCLQRQGYRCLNIILSIQSMTLLKGVSIWVIPKNLYA